MGLKFQHLKNKIKNRDFFEISAFQKWKLAKTGLEFQGLTKCAYQVIVIYNLGIGTLELGMKVCKLWKYYFHLTKYR